MGALHNLCEQTYCLSQKEPPSRKLTFVDVACGLHSSGSQAVAAGQGDCVVGGEANKLCQADAVLNVEVRKVERALAHFENAIKK